MQTIDDGTMEVLERRYARLVVVRGGHTIQQWPVQPSALTNNLLCLVWLDWHCSTVPMTMMTETMMI